MDDIHVEDKNKDKMNMEASKGHCCKSQSSKKGLDLVNHRLEDYITGKSTEDDKINPQASDKYNTQT